MKLLCTEIIKRNNSEKVENKGTKRSQARSQRQKYRSKSVMTLSVQVVHLTRRQATSKQRNYMHREKTENNKTHPTRNVRMKNIHERESK